MCGAVQLPPPRARNRVVAAAGPSHACPAPQLASTTCCTGRSKRRCAPCDKRAITTCAATPRQPHPVRCRPSPSLQPRRWQACGAGRAAARWDVVDRAQVEGRASGVRCRRLLDGLLFYRMDWLIVLCMLQNGNVLYHVFTLVLAMLVLVALSQL